MAVQRRRTDPQAVSAAGPDRAREESAESESGSLRFHRSRRGRIVRCAQAFLASLVRTLFSGSHAGAESCAELRAACAAPMCAPVAPPRRGLLRCPLPRLRDLRPGRSARSARDIRGTAETAQRSSPPRIAREETAGGTRSRAANIASRSKRTSRPSRSPSNATSPSEITEQASRSPRRRGVAGPHQLSPCACRNSRATSLVSRPSPATS